jgi:hypothetical protein
MSEKGKSGLDALWKGWTRRWQRFGEGMTWRLEEENTRKGHEIG